MIDPYTTLMTERYRDLLPGWNEERLVWTVKETDRFYVEVMPLLFTAAIILTDKMHPEGYTDRWCYTSPQAAWAAALAWDPDMAMEPAGWHRHPTTGRRRPDGDPTQEYVNP